LPIPHKQPAADGRKVIREVRADTPRLVRGVFDLVLVRSLPTMNTGQRKELANRREFLRGGARYALVAGVAAVSAVLVRKRVAGLPDQECLNEGICRACTALGDCGLPQALSFKDVTQRSRS
jgi:hypothetical protein